MVSGKSQHTKYTRACFLDYPFRWLPWTDFLDWRKHYPEGNAGYWSRSISTMPPSLTSNHPEVLGSGPWINCALWLDPCLRPTRNKWCRTQGRSWALTTTWLTSIALAGHVKFWARARFHDKVKEIIYNALAPGKFTRGSFQILRHCQLPRTRYLRPSGLRWPHGH